MSSKYHYYITGIYIKEVLYFFIDISPVSQKKVSLNVLWIFFIEMEGEKEETAPSTKIQILWNFRKKERKLSRIVRICSVWKLFQFDRQMVKLIIEYCIVINVYFVNCLLQFFPESICFNICSCAKINGAFKEECVNSQNY